MIVAKETPIGSERHDHDRRTAGDRFRNLSARPTQRPAHERQGSAAVQQGEGLHRRGRQSDERRVPSPGRRPPRRVAICPRPAGSAGSGQGQGQGRRSLELFPARRPHRRRPHEPRLRLYRRRAGQEPHGVRGDELRRPGHRQHGGSGAGRHAGTEGAVAQAAAGGKDPFGLLHDRAQHRQLGRQEHRHPRGARGRRICDQRREALHLRRRRPALQDYDLHGAHGRRERPAPADAVADPGSAAHRGR